MTLNISKNQISLPALMLWAIRNTANIINKRHFLMITFLEISLRRVTSSCFYTAISQNALRSARAQRIATCPVTFSSTGRSGFQALTIVVVAAAAKLELVGFHYCEMVASWKRRRQGRSRRGPCRRRRRDHGHRAGRGGGVARGGTLQDKET